MFKKSLFLILFIAAMTGAGCSTRPSQVAPSPQSSNETAQEQVTLKVSDKTYAKAYTKSQSAYEFMLALERTSDFRFDGKDYGQEMGFFVQSINGQANDNGKKLYWVFYLNDKKSDKGISSVKLNPNDIITWKYEPLEF